MMIGKDDFRYESFQMRGKLFIQENFLNEKR